MTVLLLTLRESMADIQRIGILTSGGESRRAELLDLAAAAAGTVTFARPWLIGT